MDVSHKLIVRNTALNLFGLAVPLAVGFVTIPMVVRALGTERFGILALVWVVFGYFGLFDLGLGRTTTRYVADSLGRGESARIPAYFWTTVLLQTAIGLAAAVLLQVSAPLIVRRFLNIPAGFEAETLLTLRLVGWSLPVMFVSASCRGALEAAQRFDLVNAVKVPLNVMFYLLPLLGVALGYSLPGIVILLILSRIAALAVWAAMDLRVLPVLRTRPALRRDLVRPLFSFSGWLGLSGILYAVTTSIDRLVIGSLLTVEAVAYYSAPYEAINRVGVVPGSLSMVLFPAFSALDAGRRSEQVESLFARSVKFLLVSTGPIFVLLMFFARDGLRLWLGPDFAAQSAFVVQALAAGFLVNTVVAVPNNYLIGIGRVDVAPKYQAVELVVFTALIWAGAKLGGIGGVAAASALRLAAFSIFLMAVSFSSGRIRFDHVWKNGLGRALAALALFAAGLAVSRALGLGLWGAGAASAGYAAAAYFLLLDDEERGFIARALRLRRAPAEPAGTEERG
ncbi:MAG TPA: flippase [Candidatus Aminicenantes bacterium]|nr:flippase [Candidatus Aminicenantes bacterium]HRY64464.1 flippase [Candidatus Aminicenantes bacterium]HRZ71377.1 flippase [Candidatus Aminicenantes bacterium]